MDSNHNPNREPNTLHQSCNMVAHLLQRWINMCFHGYFFNPVNFPSNLYQCSVYGDPQVDRNEVMSELLAFHGHFELSSCTSIQQMKYTKYHFRQACFEAAGVTVWCHSFHVCVRLYSSSAKVWACFNQADVVCVYELEACSYWQVVSVEVEESWR